MSILFIVATPLGNLEDISKRALRVLNEVDLIAAEDTRHSKILLQHYHINTAITSLHDHNEREQIPKLIALLQQGKKIALISDAGTPLISDPGYQLVVAAHTHNIEVIPIPGPCAAIAALSASGLSANQFVFAGFLAAKTAARQHQLETLKTETRTLIFYEAPHRIIALVNDLIKVLGEQRQAVIAKELTKTFETIKNGSLIELKQWLEADPNHVRGEFVVLVQGLAERIETPSINLTSEQVLEILLTELSVKQAVNLAVKITGAAKNELYQKAIEKKQH